MIIYRVEAKLADWEEFKYCTSKSRADEIVKLLTTKYGYKPSSVRVLEIEAY